MTVLAYCGERTCVNNKKGKCGNFKIGLNEQGLCMGYSPLVMPNVVSKTSNELNEIPKSGIDNPIGFGG